MKNYKKFLLTLFFCLLMLSSFLFINKSYAGYYNNQETANISITKLSENTNQPLSGASFELLNNNNVIATAKSNVNGIVSFKNIPNGKYILYENHAPSGYKGAVPEEVIVNNGKATIDGAPADSNHCFIFDKKINSSSSTETSSSSQEQSSIIKKSSLVSSSSKIKPIISSIKSSSSSMIIPSSINKNNSSSIVIVPNTSSKKISSVTNITSTNNSSIKSSLITNNSSKKHSIIVDQSSHYNKSKDINNKLPQTGNNANNCLTLIGIMSLLLVVTIII